MIRLANTQDINAIYELGLKLHDNFKKVNDLKRIMKESYFKIYVALEDNRIVGFLSITELYETVDIIDLFVSLEYRRKHIASKLLNYMIGSVSPTVNLITLEVNVNNVAAISLYEQFGFEIINKRNFYYGFHDAYLMGRRCKRI